MVPFSSWKTRIFADEKRTRRRQLHGVFLSAKRYALFNFRSNGETKISKRSEHGLGHLLNPTNPDDPSREWIDEIWRQIISDELDRSKSRPNWFEQPAISQKTITSPRLLQPFLKRKARPLYTDGVKPFNFVCSAHVMPFGHPPDVNPRKFHLISEYTRDSRKWLKTKWVDIYSHKNFHITTTVAPSANVVRVKSIRDVYEEYKAHTDAKNAGPDGGPCGANTRGLLRRRTVHAAYVELIGKESNRIDEVEHGEIHDQDEVLERYADPKNDPFDKLVLPILRLPEMKRNDLAAKTGLSPRSIQTLRNGKQRPTRKVRAALTRIAGDFVRKQLEQDIRNDLCACAALLERSE